MVRVVAKPALGLFSRFQSDTEAKALLEVNGCVAFGYLGNPRIPAPPDATNAALVVAANSVVSRVVVLSAFAQVINSVVGGVAVDVVDPYRVGAVN